MNISNRIVCVESPSRFASYLRELLKETQSIQGKFIPAEQIKDSVQNPGNCHYFMDYTTAARFQTDLLRLTETNQRVFVSVFNAPEKIATSELIKLGRLKGYFYPDVSRKHFRKSVTQILAGECELPPRISSQLINYYQSIIVRFNEPHTIDLTQREIEVLKYLRGGLSNNRLAEELFVSEHTVKSHLYKIFKKLSVSNRNQAIEWAHTYLP